MWHVRFLLFFTLSASLLASDQSSTSEREVEDIECELCLDQYDPNDIVSFCDNNHFCCKDCFIEYLKNCIKRGQIPPTCFERECRLEIPMSFLEEKFSQFHAQILDYKTINSSPEQIKIYTKNEKKLRRLLKKNNFGACPGCGVVIEKTKGCNDMACTLCGTNFDLEASKNNRYLFVKDSNGQDRCIIL